MTLTLTVDEPVWRRQVNSLRGRLGDELIPVIKGNGYGLGRAFLAELVKEWSTAYVAVGTVFELDDCPIPPPAPIVLTPSFDDHLDAIPPKALPTVGSAAHARHLRESGWEGRVIVKIATAMHRYGFPAGAVADEPSLAGLDVAAYAIHPPLTGTSTERTRDLLTTITGLPAGPEIHVSHLRPGDFEGLKVRMRHRKLRLRLGTALWHGDKSMLHLTADVIDTRPVVAGTPAGYRGTPAPGYGTLVMIGAGSAHGIAPLPDGRSPFHFARHRLDLLEPPHMHTSMVFVPGGQPCPRPGDSVDVQRPLIHVAPDRIVWTS